MLQLFLSRSIFDREASKQIRLEEQVSELRRPGHVAGVFSVLGQSGLGEVPRS